MSREMNNLRRVDKLIDVSVHNGVINWAVVRGQYDAAIIRCGFGIDKEDNLFFVNYKRARDAGMTIGTYFYSYANTIEGGACEGRGCLKILQENDVFLDLPIFYDIEERQHANLSGEELYNLVDAFAKPLEAAGFMVGVYSSKNILSKIDMKKLRRRGIPVWLAHWATETTFNHSDFVIRQYSPEGSVLGIDSYVDMNIVNLEGVESFEASQKLGDGDAADFFPSRGYFKSGDVSPNVGKLANFMRRVFPLYTSPKALGNVYGPHLIASIKEFQRRTGLTPDGCTGPITLAELKKYGFKY